MGKQNNNFEYYKPQNGSSLVLSDSESDNSDSKAMFKLPKRKVIRSRGSGFSKRKGRMCCQVCCQSVIPIVMSVFIIGTLVSIGFLLLGVNGMKRELELLKIQMKIVQSESHSNLKDSRVLQQKLKAEFKSTFDKNEEEIKAMKAKIIMLKTEINKLNATIIQLKKQSDSSETTSLPSVVKDVKLLKKGMADTGGELKKLADDSVEAKKTIALLTKIVKGLKKQLVKLGHSLRDISNKPSTTLPLDTLEPLLATTTSTEGVGNDKKSLGKVSKLLKKLLNGYNELFQNKTNHLNAELLKMNQFLQKRNSTYRQNIMTIRENIKALQNITEKHEERLTSITARLDMSKSTATSNVTSSGKLLGLVKDILVGLKKHQTLISNLTSRVEKIDGSTNVKATIATTEASLITTKGLFSPPSQSSTTEAMSAPPDTAKPDTNSTQQTEEQVLISNSNNINNSSVPVNGSATTGASTRPHDTATFARTTEASPAHSNNTFIRPSINPTVMVNLTEQRQDDVDNGTVVTMAQLPATTAEPKMEASTTGITLEAADEAQPEHKFVKPSRFGGSHGKRGRFRSGQFEHAKNKPENDAEGPTFSKDQVAGEEPFEDESTRDGSRDGSRDDSQHDRSRTKDFSRENADYLNDLDESAAEDSA